jgi:hypothetical protein
MDYMTVLDNRVWGVKGDNVYCCALGDASDWTTFSTPSEATDAWSVDTGTQGDFTGITTYRNINYAFKTDGIWRRYGDIAGNFALQRVSEIGCLSNKSIVEVNGVLYFLGRKGVYAYTGGIPELISEPLNEAYVSAVAGGDGRRYYISLNNGSEYILYVFDTWKNVWVQEDTLNVKDFTYFGGDIYAMSSTLIQKFNSGSETVTWTVTTKEFTEEISNAKGHSQINMRVDLETGSTLSVYVRIDNGSFTLAKTYTATDLTCFRVPLLIQRCDHFQIEIDVVGEGKIYAIERIFHILSDVHTVPVHSGPS